MIPRGLRSPRLFSRRSLLFVLMFLLLVLRLLLLALSLLPLVLLLWRPAASLLPIIIPAFLLPIPVLRWATSTGTTSVLLKSRMW